MPEEEYADFGNWTFNFTNNSNFNYVDESAFSKRSYTVIIIYCILFLVAAVGNLTVFFTLFKTRRRKSRISLMILHLTIADLIVTFIMIPLEVSWRLTVQWIAGNTACKAFLLLRAFGLYLSSNVLVCVSLDRYFAVLHPLKVNVARRRGKCMLVWAWSISLICAIPQSIVFHVASHPNNPKFRQCVTFGFFSSELQQMAYNLFGVIVMYFVPLIVITVAYSTILCEISKKSNESQEEIYQSTGGRMRLRRSDMSNIERARIRTLRMTITIVFVFIICWTPYVFITLWYTFDTKSAKRVPDWLQDSLFMMAVSNSCMNPLVYGSYAIDLQRNCLKCLCCCCKKTSPANITNGRKTYMCTGQSTSLGRRLFKCLHNIQKVGSAVTRSTGTHHAVGRRSPSARQINLCQPPTMVVEVPVSTHNLSYLMEPISKRSHRVSFHSDPCCYNDGDVEETSHNSDIHAAISM